MPIKHLRVKLNSSLADKFHDHLPKHGQRSRAVRRFIHIFCEECERFPLMASIDHIKPAALQAVQEILAEED